ncbi:hypothetical protein MBRA_03811 [Methylobacterium brachiatum]|nr:hypothetical protein MBRA_03811 [Methylobacterium brachiatum]
MAEAVKHTKASGRQRPALEARERALARQAAYRARLKKPAREAKAVRRVTPATARARVELKEWVDKGMRQSNSRDAAGRFFYMAMQEAREILDAPALMMALVAIGLLDKGKTGQALRVEIDNILIDVLGDSMPV